MLDKKNIGKQIDKRQSNIVSYIQSFECYKSTFYKLIASFKSVFSNNLYFSTLFSTIFSLKKF